ncbi:hypothetical protein GW17_00060228 [Ensete ventricosum]|nr:hypothetical protein GW17_00060228 [Ensete ventricosum]
MKNLLGRELKSRPHFLDFSAARSADNCKGAAGDKFSSSTASHGQRHNPISRPSPLPASNPEPQQPEELSTAHDGGGGRRQDQPTPAPGRWKPCPASSTWKPRSPDQRIIDPIRRRKKGRTFFPAAEGLVGS